MYDARRIANWFMERGAEDDRPLTIMTLVKLVYIAHGWHLALRGEPLFGNVIDAWAYGPVVPEVYFTLRPQGKTPTDPIPGFEEEITERDIGFLEQIYDIYGDMSAHRLSALTHTAGGPWETTIRLGGRFAEVPNELIRAHYLNKLKKSRQRESENAK